MRKLVYVSETGKETGSWDTAKSWGERYSIRLDEMPEQITEEERERRARRCEKIRELRKSKSE